MVVTEIIQAAKCPRRPTFPPTFCAARTAGVDDLEVRQAHAGFWPARPPCSCERVGGSRTGRAPAGVAGAWRASLMRPPGSGSCPAGGAGRVWGLVGVFAGGVLAFLSGVTSRGGRGGEERGSQPYLYRPTMQV